MKNGKPHPGTHQTPNFDRIASMYRWCEYLALGPLLERTRTFHLGRLDECRNALVLGDGDGRFTAALLRRNPCLRATAVDGSGAMLDLLRARCSFAAERLQTLQADLRGVASEGLAPDGLASSGLAPDGPAFSGPQQNAPYDLVVTHFLLDCLEQDEVDSLAQRIAPLLVPGALWLLSEFRVPAGAMRWPARVYIRTLYLAFRLLTDLRTQRLPDHAAALRTAGFRPLATERKLLGLLTTELWRHDVETVGAGPERQSGTMTAGALRCLRAVHPDGPP